MLKEYFCLQLNWETTMQKFIHLATYQSSASFLRRYKQKKWN